ncbi:MAG: radical SAM family heme chaperone HemW [Saprospiraceae bacterium]|nr:radical SAM family heme chaperone HemW [Saprospiraceae bacterium]
MPGIYIHIPYCKKACHYCNFHFSTTLRNKPAMIEAILKELEFRQSYLPAGPVDTVYFGGGTPSILEIRELGKIIKQIDRLFQVAPGAEITLEANPDDLTEEKLKDLRAHTPVNRLSIGIQSFADVDLHWMNRAHNQTHARTCLEHALRQGFQNLTIDLIYGAPTTTDAQWVENMRIAFEYQIPHLSCYSLTVEEGTALGTFVKKGKQAPMDEEQAARQFEMLMDAALEQGYEHYEISNFARPGHYAKHNTAYWLGEPYLGIGPAAHSFDGISRQWNIANNALYINSLEQSILPFEREVLTPAQQFNEYILTSMRTIWGADRQKIDQWSPAFATHFDQAVQQYLDTGTVEVIRHSYRLTRTGKLIADRIASDLFVADTPGAI